MLKKSVVAVFIALSAFLLQPKPLTAQTYNTPLPKVNDKDVQLLRQDLRAKSKQIITKNMQLTDEQAASFWPVYDQYAAEVGKINDKRFGLMKQYAEIYPTMTPEQADGLLRSLADEDTAIINLRVEYLPKFEQALPGSTKAALFFQLDRRLDYLMNVQMASQLPAIKP
ncbi:MAG: hypothetical protein WBM04_14950 [Candidatus Korobacteraceae bacterium]